MATYHTPKQVESKSWQTRSLGVSTLPRPAPPINLSCHDDFLFLKFPFVVAVYGNDMRRVTDDVGYDLTKRHAPQRLQADHFILHALFPGVDKCRFGLWTPRFSSHAFSRRSGRQKSTRARAQNGIDRLLLCVCRLAECIEVVSGRTGHRHKRGGRTEDQAASSLALSFGFIWR